MKFLAACLLLLPFLSAPAQASPVYQPGPSSHLFNHPYYACSRNFYVATTGSDNNGGSQASPWLTIAHADTSARQPGDCINVEPGIYAAFNSNLQFGGNAATSSGYVVYRCTQPQFLAGAHKAGCLITGANADLGEIAAGYNRSGVYPNYLVFDGFTFKGASGNQPGDTAIACDAETATDGNYAHGCHHWMIINNVIENHGQGGIGNEHTEYWVVSHNRVIQTAHMGCNGYYGSGIALVVANQVPGYVATADDTNANNNAALNEIGIIGGPADYPFHNLVAWNVVGNNYQGCHENYATDGNNIIIDTLLAGGLNNTYMNNPPRTVDYPFPTLVAFNISYNAGGSGIHVFSSALVTVANNSAFNNGLDPWQDGYVRTNIDIESGANTANGFGAGTDLFINNIAYAVPGEGPCGNGTNNLGSQVPFNIGGDGTHIDGDWNSIGHNISFTVGTSCHLLNQNSGNSVFQAPPNPDWNCSSNKCFTDPAWVDVGKESIGTYKVAPDGSNFALAAGSPAIGGGAQEPYLSAQAVDAGACYHTLVNCK